MTFASNANPAGPLPATLPPPPSFLAHHSTTDTILYSYISPPLHYKSTKAAPYLSPQLCLLCPEHTASSLHNTINLNTCKFNQSNSSPKSASALPKIPTINTHGYSHHNPCTDHPLSTNQSPCSLSPPHGNYPISPISL